MKSKFISLILALICATTLFAQNNVITYTASAKLNVKTSAFVVPITSHTFDNGIGTITFIWDVTIIGDGAFGKCPSLTSITIPNSVTSIGELAFSECIGLTSITIPNSVTTIKGNAFNGCTGLTSITVESGNSIYDSRENCNAIIETSTNTLILGCKNTIIPADVTSLGEYAFIFCSSLTSVTIPNSVTFIGEHAFYGCTGLEDIYCYATTPPACVFNGKTFDGVSNHCYIHVPAGTMRAYQLAPGWSQFLHFYEISTLPDGAPTDQVGVTVENNYATFTWPVNPTASSYTLVIKKDGVVFCSLIFNSMGQLVGMAFAPGREHSHQTSSAEETAYGFSFVVTGLDAGAYEYTFTAKDASDNVLENYVGTFNTTANGLIDTMAESQQSTSKFFRDGHICIRHDGHIYTAQGQMVE